MPCSPRPRGCSRVGRAADAAHRLLPAPAGMFPRHCSTSTARTTAPRARGDVPEVAGGQPHHTLCSPRPRGCSRDVPHGHVRVPLLPAPAGMFPTYRRGSAATGSAPRARGDVPESSPVPAWLTPCSPRPRGCSNTFPYRPSWRQLLPAPAGMFPWRSDREREHHRGRAGVLGNGAVDRQACELRRAEPATDGRQDQATGSGLLDPGRRNGAHAAGSDHPVVRCPLGVAEKAVAADERGVHPPSAQGCPCTRGHFLVVLDRGDPLNLAVSRRGSTVRTGDSKTAGSCRCFSTPTTRKAMIRPTRGVRLLLEAA